MNPTKDVFEDQNEKITDDDFSAIINKPLVKQVGITDKQSEVKTYVNWLFFIVVFGIVTILISLSSYKFINWEYNTIVYSAPIGVENVYTSESQFVTSLVQSVTNNTNEKFKDLEQQIQTINSMTGNVLMVITVILGLFTLLIAVIGFYLSRLISDKVDQINSLSIRIIEANSLVDNAFKQVTINLDSAKKVADELQLEIKNYVEEKNNDLYQRYEKSRRDNIMKQIGQDPEKLDIFFSDILLDLDKFEISEIELIFDKSELMDVGFLSKSIYLLMLKDPQKTIDIDFVEFIIQCFKTEFLQFWYPSNTIDQFLNIIADLGIKLGHDKNGEVVEFMKVLMLRDGGNKTAKVLTLMHSAQRLDGFIKKLLDLDANILAEYILNRKQVLDKFNNEVVAEEKKLLLRIQEQASQ